MKAPAERKRSRLEIAAEAWEALLQERNAHPPSLESLREVFPAEEAERLHRIGSEPRGFTMQQQMDYLVTWVRYCAARHHPLLEALSTFGVRAPLRARDSWEITCDTLFPGHRHIGDNLRWRAGWRLDPRVTFYGNDWTDHARSELGEWLKRTEYDLASQVAPS